MTSKAALVFLHGVGPGDPDDGWKESLATALVECGYPALDGVSVIAPKYPNSLFDYPDDEKHEVPPIQIRPLRGDRATEFRRDLERRTSHLEAMLGPDEGGVARPAAKALVTLGVPIKRQASRYINNERSARARVLKRVIDQIPPTGDIVLVGHSLGSIVALDLVRRLPPEVHVKGLVTLGSPAGHPQFQKGSDRLELRNPPPHNVDWWVNFWSAGDPITSLQGISHSFPWVLDRRLSFPAHKSERYLADPGVAAAIGWALFGSLSKELVRASANVDRPTNAVETAQLLEVAYGHFLRDHLRGERRARYQSALAQTQSQRAWRLRDAYGATRHGQPHAIARLVEDGLSFNPEPHRPDVPHHFSKAEACLLVLGVIQRNPVEPFEIEMKDEVRRAAAGDLSVAMGLGTKLGQRAHGALEFAGGVINPRRAGMRWWLVGAGAVAVVAGTGGLALAATPGLYGAAATVSALAAFGPGGMVGGLVTAGALTSTGMGAIAGGLAKAASAEAVESLVVFQVALCKLREDEGLDHEDDVWLLLTQLEREVVRELVRVTPFSDDDAPSVKLLNRKLRAIQRALACITDRAWASPAVCPDEPQS